MRKWKSGWCAPMMMMCTIFRVAHLMQSINQIDVWSGLSRDLEFDDIHFEFAFVQIIYVWIVAIQKSSKLITWHWIAGLEDDQKRPSDICITNFRLAELFSARIVHTLEYVCESIGWFRKRAPKFNYQRTKVSGNDAWIQSDCTFQRMTCMCQNTRFRHFHTHELWLCLLWQWNVWLLNSVQ